MLCSWCAQPFAASLGCKVIVVLTYGVIGWSAETKDNEEREEKGRGEELGLPGSKHALPGITAGHPLTLARTPYSNNQAAPHPMPVPCPGPLLSC